jgi:hypothetical protein
LSWPGTIQRYDSRSRQVAATWRFDAAEPARLAGVVGSEPMSLAGGVARAGVREIARGIRDMFTSGSHVWLTREDRGQRYLEARPVAALTTQSSTPATMPSCLFRTSGAGVDAGVPHDARRLPNGLVAVTTDAGLKLHSRDHHSWYDVAGLLPDTGRDTLATIGSALIVWDSAETLQVVRAPVTPPDSCSTAPVRVDAAERINARAVAIDERAGTAYVVRDEGGVDRVDDTTTRSMLGSESQGPPEAEIVRSWHFPDTAASVLWVGTRRSLWQYDLGSHYWLEWKLQFPSTTPGTGQVSLDLDAIAGQIAVFVTAGSETFRGTVASEPGRQPKIELVRSTSQRAESDRRAQSPEFRIGAVTFFRDVSQGRLAVLRHEDGRSTVAYQNRAFAWDRGRRGIAIGLDGPLLLTDAGVHSAGSLASLSSFDPGPPGAPSPSDRLT